MSELIKYIENIKPFDEKEARDKEATLQFLKSFPEKMWSIRENLIGHLTASAFIVNKEHTKVLFAHHNIYNSWAWLGGHADGDLDLLNVAEKETKEESGLDNFKLLSDVADISVMGITNHFKKDKWIPDHLHYNLTYIFEADENQEIRTAKGENSAVAWLDLDTLFDKVTETNYVPTIYKRLIEKLKQL